MEGRSGHIICKLVTQKPHALFRAAPKSGCRDNEPEMQEDVVIPRRMNSVPLSHSIPLHWESHVGLARRPFLQCPLLPTDDELRKAGDDH